MRNSPVSTAILIICVILYFVEQTNGHPENADTAIRYGAMYAPMVKRGQYWRLVSACFVHFGIWHIIANMYSLYALGPGAEAILGSVPFAVLYLGSGFCGNLVTYLRDEKRGRNSVSAGASGAIFGLMGAFLVIALDPRYRAFVSIRSLLVTLAINLVYGAASRRINQWAHLGGLVSGMIITFVLLRFV